MDEVGALDTARQALAAGEPGVAIGLLDAHDRRFAQPALRAESSVLRVEALLALGRVDEGRRLAEDLLHAQPDGPYARRLRSLLGEASPNP
jgi:hypothetical protein